MSFPAKQSDHEHQRKYLCRKGWDKHGKEEEKIGRKGKENRGKVAKDQDKLIQGS